LKETYELPVDHEGVNIVKICFWGASLSGKTTALSIYKTLKTLENPESVYQWLKLEDPSGRTLFFDQAVFSLGRSEKTGLPYLKYHVYTVPGQIRHKGQRKVVLEGSHGLIILLDSSLSELANGTLPFKLVLNKMDLPPSERISAIDVGELLVEAGLSEKLRDAYANIIETSCLKATNDLKRILIQIKKEGLRDKYKDPKTGRWIRSVLPVSVQRIMQPVEELLREVIVIVLRKNRDR
jgi:GTPase SAR1 family protein